MIKRFGNWGFRVLNFFGIWSLVFGILPLVSQAAFTEPTCDPNVDPGACNTPPPVWNQTSTTQSGGFRLQGDAISGRMCLSNRCIASWDEISGLRLPLDPIYFTAATGDKIGLHGPLTNADGTPVANVNAIGIENDSTGAPTIMTYRSGGEHRFFSTNRTQSNLRITPEGNLIGRGTFTSIGRAQIGLFVTPLTGTESLIGGAMAYNAAETNTKLLDLGAFSGLNQPVSRLIVGQSGDLTLRGLAGKIDVKSPSQPISGTTGDAWSGQSELALVLQQTDLVTGTVFKLPVASRFILRNETTGIDTQEVKLAWTSRSPLGTISRLGGYFLDRQYNTAVTLNTSGTAARFTGPVSISGNTSITGNLSATGTIALGSASTNLAPQITTPQDVQIRLDADTVDIAKSAKFSVYGHDNEGGVRTPREVFRVTEDGNVWARGSISSAGNENGVFRNIQLTATPTPTIFAGSAAIDSDQTLRLRHAEFLTNPSTIKLVHLDVPGNITATGDLVVNGSGRFSGGLTASPSLLTPRINTSDDSTLFIGTTRPIAQRIAMTGAQLDLPHGSICLDDNDGECVGSLLATRGTLSANRVIQRGFDLAEQFEVSLPLAPGTLVRSEGKIRIGLTHMSYDRQVIGVVSGEPGSILGYPQENMITIALAGRVPTNVTTENGPIKIGDLLTSSSTSGYAMRCSDPVKCFGTVIGKALEPFTRGKGQILVLIGLQ